MLQLSNDIKICTESLTFLRMANLEGRTLESNTYQKFYHKNWFLLPKMSLHHQFLLGNILNDRIGTIETSQKMLQTYSVVT